MSTTRRYRALCRKFVSVASRAASSEEASVFLENKLKTLIDEVDKMLSTMPSEGHEASLLVPDLNASVQQDDVSIPYNAGLKKKEGRKRGKRLKPWNEKMHKKRRNNLHVQNLKDQPEMVSQRNKKNQAHQNKEYQRQEVYYQMRIKSCYS